ncbi:hypothetical protein B0I18_101323 [Taibaiella chishuiensis]|uniref:Uncharacterized protein n=2 Tax=Taibaiella chishuiensis TaxID=1434707 RepID=A0A2P8DAB7_9BACT|nr:hypothetical protein B0I18_101323 [Taibaiella chishuiensis]
MEEILREYFPTDRYYGVALSVDNYWSYYQTLEVMEAREHPYWHYLLRLAFFNKTHQPPPSMWDIEFLYPFLKTIKFDFSSRPLGWREHCALNYYPENSSPVVIIVNPKLRTPRESDFINVGEYSYRVVYDNGQPSRAIYNPVVGFFDEFIFRKKMAPSVLVKSPKVTTGTLGGILCGHATGKKYLASCAHVLQTIGNDVFSQHKRFEKIGKVIHTEIPDLSALNDTCSIEHNPDLHSIDIALAEMTTSPNRIKNLNKLAKADKIAKISEMSPNMKVSFTGKSSGTVEARLGPLTLWDQIEFEEGKRCFGRIFQLKPLGRQYIYSPLARHGDSGSWITQTDGVSTAWCGVVIATGEGRAEACFSETIISKCNHALGENLTL